MGKPKLEELLEKVREVVERIYLHGEGKFDFEMRTSIERKEKEAIIRAGETFRFREKIVDKGQEKK